MLELSGVAELPSALDAYQRALWLFHTTVENGKRIFNSPRFIPNQREYWACLSSAIGIAVVLDRGHLAVRFSQLVKFDRSPVGRVGPATVLEYLPDLPAHLHLSGSGPAAAGSGGRRQSSELPATVWQLHPFISRGSAILDIHRNERGLLLTLLDHDGIRTNSISAGEIYRSSPTLHRLVRLTDTDLALDRAKAAWLLDYRQAIFRPAALGQWGVGTNLASTTTPFTMGLEGFNELYGILFRGLDEHLAAQGITQLAVSPDGTLNLMSFAALVDDAGRFLLDRFCFSYAPNLSTLLWCLANGHRRARHAMLVADPSGTLPLAGGEIDAIAGHLRSAEVHVAAPADSVPDLLDKLGAVDLMHFACHGAYDSRNPDRSGIALDRDRFLSAAAIAEHGLRNGALAVLSACETAHSSLSGRYGLPGLAHAFLRAGASTVIASLWKIPDMAAYLLMAKLYERLFQLDKPLDAAVALAEAQRWLRGLSEDDIRSYPGQTGNARWPAMVDLEMARSRKLLRPLFGEERPPRRGRPLPDVSLPFAHPFYWAGFMVLGDWRSRTLPQAAAPQPAG